MLLTALQNCCEWKTYVKRAFGVVCKLNKVLRVFIGAHWKKTDFLKLETTFCMHFIERSWKRKWVIQLKISREFVIFLLQKNSIWWWWISIDVHVYFVCWGRSQVFIVDSYSILCSYVWIWLVEKEIKNWYFLFVFFLSAFSNRQRSGAQQDCQGGRSCSGKKWAH